MCPAPTPTPPDGVGNSTCSLNGGVVVLLGNGGGGMAWWAALADVVGLLDHAGMLIVAASAFARLGVIPVAIG